MQAVIIDVNGAEAYVSLQDGTYKCIGLTHLPSNIKTGMSVNIYLGTTQMINHEIIGNIL